MSQATEKHAARMRAERTEVLRKKRWGWIDIQLRAGNLTVKEAQQIMKEFWEERLADKKKILT